MNDKYIEIKYVPGQDPIDYNIIISMLNKYNIQYNIQHTIDMDDGWMYCYYFLNLLENNNIFSNKEFLNELYNLDIISKEVYIHFDINCEQIFFENVHLSEISILQSYSRDNLYEIIILYNKIMFQFNVKTEFANNIFKNVIINKINNISFNSKNAQNIIEDICNQCYNIKICLIHCDNFKFLNHNKKFHKVNIRGFVDNGDNILQLYHIHHLLLLDIPYNSCDVHKMNNMIYHINATIITLYIDSINNDTKFNENVRII